MNATTPQASVPVHVLTGFLGSGKTTLLNRLLKSQALPHSAVIVNEFGEVGIDHLLVEHSEDNLVELAGGCVCCTVRGDLARTVLDLLNRRTEGRCSPFEQIIVETTGLADPTPIGNLLVTDPDLAHSVHLASVSTTVDAVNGPATLATHPNAVRQVALADQLILTKSDLAGVSANSLPQRLSDINPRATFTTAAFGELADDVTLFHWPAESATEQGIDWRAGSHHHHAEGIDSFVLRRKQPIPGAALALFIEVLTEHAGSSLLRVKGLVEIDESPDGPALLQGAQHVFQELDFLDHWPDGERGTRLVFITQGINAQWIEALLDALVWETLDISERLSSAT